MVMNKLRHSSKGQGLSLNTIIIAILVVLVLVVLVAVFVGRIGNTEEQLQSCGAYGGQCSDDACGGSFTDVDAKGCGTNQKCCVRKGIDALLGNQDNEEKSDSS